jgi:hypothetical protein
MYQKKIFFLAVALVCIFSFSMLITPPLFASCPSCERVEKASATEIVGDLFLIRPVWFAFTVLGTGAFVVTSPFTVIGGNIKHAAEVCVVKPAKRTFSYPLGAY